MKSDYEKALPEEWRDMSRVFSALGDEHRQRILLLFERGERLTASQIAAVVPLSRTAVVYHIKTLRDANVLLSEKVGKEVFFWLNIPFVAEAMRRVLKYINENH
jgi:DNA-binding transcriptional ArsR family regulator